MCLIGELLASRNFDIEFLQSLVPTKFVCYSVALHDEGSSLVFVAVFILVYGQTGAVY